LKLLVFGGSFDPPHRGHAALLAAAARAVRPDRILVIPAWNAPLKGAPAAPAAERVILARLGIVERLPARWRRLARVDAREARAGRRVYTVETLAALARPGVELHFVCGSDAAASFARWKSPGRLRRLATWWSAARPGTRGAVPAFFRRVPGRFPDLSSTALRSALALGRPTGAALAPAVRRSVEARGLYGGALRARLAATLKPSRYAHTLAVAELAEELARRHGADPEKARLAGLLHDAGRRFAPWELAARARRLGAPRAAATAAREPMLLHAYASADLARREFGVDDPEVLSAVSKHTLGHRRMSPLDRVLYTADACSADRSYPGVAALRALARRDLDAAFRACVKAKLDDARRRGAWIHPLTEALWATLAAR
jgi:nicotinate-nucleotide adenylyltransferase